MFSSPGNTFVHHIYRLLLMDTWSHLCEERGGSSFFPSHVSDDMEDPRHFGPLRLGGAVGCVPGGDAQTAVRNRLHPPHGLSCCSLCVHTWRNRKDFPAPLFPTQFRLLGCPFSCSRHHILWAALHLRATRSQFPTRHHLHLPSGWRCGTS